MMQHLPLLNKQTAADELPAGAAAGDDASGLKYWEETRDNTSPNDSLPAHVWTTKLVADPSADFDLDAVIRPKGGGSLLAAVPDATSTGGNKRGIYSVDWQLVRDNADEVVASDYSGMVAGHANKIGASSTYAFLGGGSQNKIDGGSSQYCALAGGTANEINGDSVSYSFVGGGNTNKINSSSGSGYNAIGGGSQNLIDGAGEYAAIAGGNQNHCTAAYAGALSGSQNLAAKDYSAILGGISATTRANNQQAHGTGFHGLKVGGSVGTGADYYAVQGQRGQYVLTASTNSATAVFLVTDGAKIIIAGVLVPVTADNQINLVPNSSFAFSGRLVARDITLGASGPGDTTVIEFKGGIKQLANAASTTLVGTVTQTAVCNDAGAATWAITITADTTNGALALSVSGQALKHIIWTATVETSELFGP